MDNRDPMLCKTFVLRAKEVLALHPDLKHSWSIDEDEDHCILDFPEACDQGFAITVEVSPAEIVVFGKGFHQHFAREDSATKPIEQALGLVRDLLSKRMRIRECLSSGLPYRWHVESMRDGKWIEEASTGMLFWNYFGERSQRIYQNDSLNARAD